MEVIREIGADNCDIVESGDFVDKSPGQKGDKKEPKVNQRNPKADQKEPKSSQF